MTIPEGWTDDMTIVLGSGTIVELVDVIIDARIAGIDPERTLITIQERFRVSPDDAALAIDRTYGGIVRAKTKNPVNCPDQRKDPIAFESYERARRDSTLIERMRA